MASTNTPAIERELDRIRSLDVGELRREWRRLYQSEPPKISRDLLTLALGYRLQEIEHGGLGKATHRKLQTIAKALRTTGRVGATPSLSVIVAHSASTPLSSSMSLVHSVSNDSAMSRGSRFI